MIRIGSSERELPLLLRERKTVPVLIPTIRNADIRVLLHAQLI